MISALAKQSHRKLRRDGLNAFLNQVKYKAWTKIAGPLGDHYYQQFPLVTRDELLVDAEFTLSSGTEYVSNKGPSGCPANPPRAYYRPGPRFVTEVPDARVIAYRGLPLTKDREIITECVGPPVILPRRPRKAVEGALRQYGIRGTKHRVLTPPERVIERPVAHLLPLFQNYYHWLVESVGKLAILEEYGQQTGTYPDILVPARRKAWMQDILDAADYPGGVVDWWRDTAGVETLVVPSYPDPTAFELGYLRERLASGVPGDGPRRVLLDRQDASQRRLANHATVVDHLRDHDWVIATPGEHSIREQIRLVKSADVIAGPHGAGLTNILWATDARVIELAGVKQSATYARLSDILGHDYHRLECGTQAGDLIADPNRIQETAA